MIRKHLEEYVKIVLAINVNKTEYLIVDTHTLKDLRISRRHRMCKNKIVRGVYMPKNNIHDKQNIGKTYQIKNKEDKIKKSIDNNVIESIIVYGSESG